MYNIKTGAWTEIIPNIPNSDGLAFSPFFSMLPVPVGRKGTTSTDYNKEGMYCTSPEPTGRVWIFDDEDPVYYDGPTNATPFTSIFRTKDVDLGLPSEYKRSPSYTIRHKESTVNPLTSKLTVNGNDLPTVNVPNVTTVSKQSRMKGPGYFRKVSVELTDPAAQYTEIEAITLSVKKKTGLTETQT
jgi:hypothetical protein